MTIRKYSRLVTITVILALSSAAISDLIIDLSYAYLLTKIHTNTTSHTSTFVAFMCMTLTSSSNFRINVREMPFFSK